MLIKMKANLTNNQIIACAVVVMLFCSVLFIKARNQLKPFENTIFKFSGYRLGHFILYMIAGYLFPEKWVLFLCIGIVWEILEAIFNKIEGGKWWGNATDHASDVFVNMAGFFTGAYLTF